MTYSILPGVQTERMPSESVEQLWPPSDAGPLNDRAILVAYAMPDRPTLRVNFVSSADGAATLDGKSGGMGGPADKRIFDLLRVTCDAVMVGAGTLRAEGYGPIVLDDRHQALRAAAGLPPHPVLVIVSGALDIEPSDPMIAEAPVRPWVITHNDSPRDRRAALEPLATVLVAGETVVDFHEALGGLHGGGLRHILCEGGPTLFGTLVAADVLDEVCLTVAPKLAGAGAGRIIAGPPSELREMSLGHVLRSGADELFLRYVRRAVGQPEA